ncbi:RNA-binding domain-containing protein [Pyrobaculum neutrophilum]|uniref:Exosome subunit n=1 Tax=Pyrobaculum neutrophilum (strain DSM 2338 / JCM 9278 / NBRC 100436 / V24Sta) TaxID=444157 RepID=B1Y984_PYRNV|nr:RNA-binding domain-containing protein [Pyrobaculum neutrophilum]ACB40313.1 Protein of unknown function DUF54 [Pyrobaculum neutrophilum V24Sta]
MGSNDREANCRPISLFYARVYVHATEDPDKVLAALKNVAEGPYVARSAKGHHGNPIQIVELKLHDCEALEAVKSLVARLDDVEFTLLLSGVEERRVYVKLDKQQAYRGVLRISHGDDVIYVEARGRGIAVDDMRSFLLSLRKALKT